MPGTGWRRITFTDRDDLQKILEVRYSMLVNVVRPLFVPLPACTHPLLIPLPRMHFNVPMSSVCVHLFAERMSNETKTKKTIIRCIAFWSFEELVKCFEHADSFVQTDRITSAVYSCRHFLRNSGLRNAQVHRLEQSSQRRSSIFSWFSNL